MGLFLEGLHFLETMFYVHKNEKKPNYQKPQTQTVTPSPSCAKSTSFLLTWLRSWGLDPGPNSQPSGLGLCLPETLSQVALDFNSST